MKSFINPADIDEAQKRIESLELTDKPKFGTFSADRMVCHLIDALSASYGLKGEQRAEKSFFTTALGKWLIIDSPIPWPKGKIKAPFDYFFETKPREDFEADKRELLELLSRMKNPEDISFTESPGFGKLSVRQWARLHCRHINHHLKQFGR